MRTPSQHPFVRSTRVSALVILAVLASPHNVLAQQSLSPIQVDSRRVTRENTRADTLEAEALTLYAKPSKFFVAARLHRRAGVLRGEDPRAVESFRSAAWMYSAAGDNSIAREMMEKAAERASVVGDVEKAANAYIDASLLAIASGREDKVPALLGRMRAVLVSPLLTADRRGSILQRIGDTPSLAKVDATH